MNKKNSQENIVIDELSLGLYQYHIENNNNRIARVLRTLFLRSDFQDFLVYIRNNFILEECKENAMGQKGKLYSPNLISSNYISNYIDEISKSAYFQKQNSEFQRDFLQIAKEIVLNSYLWTYANEKNRGIFHNCVFTDEGTYNYTNVSHSHYQKEFFWDTFGEAFFHMPKKQDWSEKHPMSMTSLGPDYIKGKSTGEPDPEKLCQVIIYENAELSEVTDYIKANWFDIKSTLRANRPPRIEKRISADKTFLRDIEIYNKYQEFKKEGFKNPDNKVWMWLKNDREVKVVIEPNSIRKIVSILKKDADMVNCEK